MNELGWEKILGEGETVLWQGRPDSGVVWKVSYAITFLFGLFFAGFALVWMTMASQAGGMFWMFGMIHFIVGLCIAVLPPFWGAWRRKHMWYTLTNRRAFIATDTPFIGRRLKSYPIESDTPIEYLPGPHDSIHFAHEYRSSKNGSRRIEIGFERIEDGDEVYRLIRDVQAGTI